MTKLFALMRLLFLMLVCVAAHADGSPLVQGYMSASDERTLLTADERGKVEGERSRKAARTATVVQMDANALTGTIITFAALNGKVMRFVKTKSEQSKGDKPDEPNPAPSTLWYGRSQSGGEVALIARDGQIVGGTIKDLGTILLIRPLGKYQVLVDIDENAMSDHAPTWSPETSTEGILK